MEGFNAIIGQIDPNSMELDPRVIARNTFARATNWRFYIGALVERIRDLAIDSIPPAIPTINDVREQLSNTEELTEPEARATQRALATQTNLLSLPEEIFHMVLDRMVGFNPYYQADPIYLSRITSLMIHQLHKIEAATPQLAAMVARWAQTQKVRDEIAMHIMAFDDWVHVRADYDGWDNLLAGGQHGGGDLRYRLRRGETLGSLNELPEQLSGYSLAWECASCTDCFEFLLRHDFVRPQGYDGCGRSWIAAALDRSNEDLCFKLLEILTLEQCFQSQDVHAGEGNYEKSRVFMRELSNRGWVSSFELLVDRLVAAHEDLVQYIDHDTQFQLCRVATFQLAEKLRLAGINIASVSKWTGVRTYAWHLAIYNPAGAGFLDWVERHCLAEAGPQSKDTRGRTYLMLAVDAGQLEAVKWFASRVNIHAGWQAPPDVRRGPHQRMTALNFAAGSFHENSVEIFRFIRSRLPPGYFEAPVNASEALRFIISNLRLQLDHIDRFLSQVAGSRETKDKANQRARAKIAEVMQDVSHLWDGSRPQQAVVAMAQDNGFREIVRMVKEDAAEFQV